MRGRPSARGGSGTVKRITTRHQQARSSEDQVERARRAHRATALPRLPPLSGALIGFLRGSSELHYVAPSSLRPLVPMPKRSVRRCAWPGVCRIARVPQSGDGASQRLRRCRRVAYLPSCRCCHVVATRENRSGVTGCRRARAFRHHARAVAARLEAQRISCWGAG